jgi:ribose/xylose/arabinose/galactoside ABC-type transport system permease subunit
VSWALGRRGTSEADEASLVADEGEGSVVERTLQHFDELLYHVGPFTIVGLIVAAYVQAALPTGAAAGLATSGLDILVVSLVAMPSYVCAASATPLAAVLLAKGFSPGAVLAGLLLGPATNVATVGFLRAAFGGRAAFLTLGGLILGVWACAFAVNQVGLPATLPPSLDPEHHEHGWLGIGASVVLALFVLRAVWRSGLRGWFASLGEALGSHDHHHGHDHAHAHVSEH